MGHDRRDGSYLLLANGYDPHRGFRTGDVVYNTYVSPDDARQANKLVYPIESRAKRDQNMRPLQQQLAAGQQKVALDAARRIADEEELRGMIGEPPSEETLKNLAMIGFDNPVVQAALSSPDLGRMTVVIKTIYDQPPKRGWKALDFDRGLAESGGGLVKNAVKHTAFAPYALYDDVRSLINVGYHPIRTVEGIGGAMDNRIRAMLSGDLKAWGKTTVDVVPLFLGGEGETVGELLAAQRAARLDLTLARTLSEGQVWTSVAPGVEIGLPKPRLGLGSGNGAMSSLSAPAADTGAYWVAGQTTRPATATEIARYNAGMRGGGVEIGFVTYRDGRVPSLFRGTPNGVDIYDGPDIATTSHTHPGNSAIFSSTDIGTYRVGDFLPDTQHSVTGLKWPATARYIQSLPGLESTPGQLAREGALNTTIFTQSALNAGGARPYWAYRWLEARLSQLSTREP